MNELYFYAVFGLLLFCRKERVPWLLLAWLGVILALGVPEATARALSPYPLLSLITHPMTVEFIAGCLAALYLPLLRRLGGWELFALGWAFLLFVSIYNPEPSRQTRLLWYGIPCLFIFTGAVLGETYHQWRFPTWLVRIGDWSYSLYLCHVLFFGIASKLWPKVLGTGVAQSVLFCIWLAVAALVAAWASYRWVETPLLKFCYRFTPK
jgi:peptidoglycan/LPS O-acetylase OafA/YrhL